MHPYRTGSECGRRFEVNTAGFVYRNDLFDDARIDMALADPDIYFNKEGKFIMNGTKVTDRSNFSSI